VLVKLRTRLLGPLVSLLTNSIQAAVSLRSNSVDTAFHEIDTLSTTSQLHSASNSPREQNPHSNPSKGLTRRPNADGQRNSLILCHQLAVVPGSARLGLS
jgi:hypothetical protein